MDRLRQRVSQIPGLTLYLQPTQDLTIDAESGPTQFRVSIEGADNATVNQWATKLAEQMRTRHELRNVVSDVGASANAAYVKRGPRQRLAHVDHRRSIDDALYSAFGQRIVSTIFTETNQYRVIPGSAPRRHHHPHGRPGQPADPHRLRQGHALSRWPPSSERSPRRCR